MEARGKSFIDRRVAREWNVCGVDFDKEIWRVTGNRVRGDA